MTFTIKLRGAPHATELADFECPTHGRFEARVLRPAPDRITCPSWVTWDADGEVRSVPCAHWAEWRISAPGAVRMGTQMVQGKIDAYPGEHHVMDTRPLADGMPLAEFKARRAAVHRDIALKQMRKMTGR